MTLPVLLVPQHVFEDWATAVHEREPRALELAHALTLTLPESAETAGLRATSAAAEDANAFEISNDALELMQSAHAKYEALERGDFERIEVGNPNILAYARRTDDEYVLIVNNLARVSQPVKFREFAGKPGWDILNRVEFTFPARAQLEAYEFLWLLVE